METKERIHIFLSFTADNYLKTDFINKILKISFYWIPNFALQKRKMVLRFQINPKKQEVFIRQFIQL